MQPVDQEIGLAPSGAHNSSLVFSTVMLPNAGSIGELDPPAPLPSIPVVRPTPSPASLLPLGELRRILTIPAYALSELSASDSPDVHLEALNEEALGQGVIWLLRCMAALELAHPPPSEPLASITCKSTPTLLASFYRIPCKINL
jgi:hypothetical protein